MTCFRLPLAASALIALAACGGDVTPDYESYKTANPYGSGARQVTPAPAPVATSAAPYVSATPAPAVAAPTPVASSGAASRTPATTGSRVAFKMTYETNRMGGTARVNGETVEVRRAGKATSGNVTYVVMFMGKSGQPTAIAPVQQPGIAADVVRGMSLCQVTEPAMASSGDVLSFVGGVPEARYIVKAVCP
ncbi:hypothetical protein [Celeribacter naphthalenivorans]|uniref:hypothetical protein n=1 Tax=Celeribacter naphthalenivorans TaxID=1614694 RepID=UPI001CFAEF1D|nr:hypothetical protein [Celeribacter naphthalenivorans]